MSASPRELLDLADAAIHAILEGLLGADRSQIRVTTKSTSTDMVSEFDEWCEETIVATIAAARPNDGFIGEEGTSRETKSGVTWIIDPIDGTTNFLYDIPGYGISIAARVNGIDTVGVVHDPVRGERFRAILGAGATCNGHDIRASACTELDRALVATGFSYDASRRRSQAEVLTEIAPAVRDIRRLGGAAVDLCMLACGRVDAYYERGLSDWDAAAGTVIAAEAGAVMGHHHVSGGAHHGAAPGIAEAFTALLDRSGAHRA